MMRSHITSRGRRIRFPGSDLLDETPFHRGNVMNDERLAAREAHRVAKRTTLRSPVERDVTDLIVGNSRAGALPADRRRTARIAGAVESELAETIRVRRELDHGWNVLGRMGAVDYLFCTIYGLMGLRLAVALLWATPASSLVRVINALTDPLYAPFRALIGIPATEGSHTLALPILIAIVGYMLLHATISGVVRLAREQRSVA